MSAALRARVAKGLSQVVAQGKSLTEVLPSFDSLNDKDKALARELTFGTLRQFYLLEAVSKQLLNKPLKAKDSDIFCLILVGLYQLYSTRIPDHAVLSETVQAALKLKKQWAKGLINALLRKALRESEQLLTNAKADSATKALFPRWLYDQINHDWPDSIEEITEKSHLRAPLTLRVNRRHNSRDDYLARLQQAKVSATIHPLAEQALLLDKSCDITTLPGFQDGDFSVQDSAAQMAAQLLDVKPGQRILDACAAPGGKTAHILELTDNQSEVVAIDNSAIRLQRLEENLERLKLKAKTIVADATDTDGWFKGELFDRILCDAPCSAIGIIRRHPDIALLRRQEDIAPLNAIQMKLLDALWMLLKPGGILLYATCSILKSENAVQVNTFLQRHSDAKILEVRPEESEDSHLEELGWQILPGELKMDGFYYAKLFKQP